jgi:hypothetical protein
MGGEQPDFFWNAFRQSYYTLASESIVMLSDSDHRNCLSTRREKDELVHLAFVRRSFGTAFFFVVLVGFALLRLKLNSS